MKIATACLAVLFSIGAWCGPGHAEIGPSQDELNAADARTDWLLPNHDYAGQRFVDLQQITRDNALQLRPVCIYNSGDLTRFPNNPLVYDGVMSITIGSVTVAIVGVREHQLPGARTVRSRAHIQALAHFCFDRHFTWRGGFSQLNWKPFESLIAYGRYDWLHGDRFDDTDVGGVTGPVRPREWAAVTGLQWYPLVNLRLIAEYSRHAFMNNASSPSHQKVEDDFFTIRAALAF
jgi:hypothetical protein